MKIALRTRILLPSPSDFAQSRQANKPHHSTGQAIANNGRASGRLIQPCKRIACGEAMLLDHRSYLARQLAAADQFESTAWLSRQGFAERQAPDIGHPSSRQTFPSTRKWTVPSGRLGRGFLVCQRLRSTPLFRTNEQLDRDALRATPQPWLRWRPAVRPL